MDCDGNDELEAARVELARIRAVSRTLSRRIGDAKRAGHDAAGLISEKNLISQQEREAAARVRELDTATSVDPPALERGVPAFDAPAPAIRGAEPMPATDVAVRTLDAVGQKRWDAYVDAHGAATSYHRADWAQVIAEAFGHSTCYLCAEHQDKIVGVLPAVQLRSRLFGNFFVSMPFLNYGGVLADSPAVAARLRASLEEIARERSCSHVEYRELHPVPDRHCWSEKVCMWLDLPTTVQALHDGLGSKVRAQIRKAERTRLSLRVGTEELLNDFYGVFASNMRDLGTPVYGKRWFQAILRRAPGQPKLFVAYRGQEPVSGSLVIAHGDRLEVPWASTVRSANRYNANMFLYARMLEHAVERGFRRFDFGRTTPDSGTWRFKKQWGAVPVTSHWCYWLHQDTAMPALRTDNPKYRLAIAAWRRLPVWFTRMVGPSIVRNIP